MIAKHLLPAGRKKMALGFSPLTSGADGSRPRFSMRIGNVGVAEILTPNKSEGGEIMSDFERLYLVIMIISLVLAAIQIGRDGKDKK